MNAIRLIARQHVLAAAALLLAGCGKSGGGPTAPPGAISVYLATSPNGAAVSADGNATGTYTPTAVRVAAGASLRLSLLGYADSTLTAPAQPETLRVSLRPTGGTPAHFAFIQLSPPPACPRAGSITVGQDGKIYVPSLCGSNGTLNVYSSTGVLVSSWALARNIGIYEGQAVDSQGDVFVASKYGNNSYVDKYSAAGTYLYTLTYPGSGAAYDIFLSGVMIGSGDSVYVCVLGMVLVYGRDNTASTRTVDVSSSSTQFGSIARDASGNWYAATLDSVMIYSDAVFKVAPEGGTAVSSWQIILNGIGDVLGVGGDGRLYVYASRATGIRVQRFSLDPQLLAEWTIKAPDAPGTFSDFGVALAPNGDIFELTNGTLSKWSN